MLCEQWVGRMMRVDVLLRRTRKLGLSANTVGMSEQESWGMSKTDLALPPRPSVPKKYPLRAVVYPGQAKPAHNVALCTDSKGNQAGKTSPAKVPPCRRSAMRCPLCCFWRSALTEHGAKTIAYNQSKNESKQKRETDKQRRKEQTSTSKRACKRACYYNTSKTDHALINTIPP